MRTGSVSKQRKLFYWRSNCVASISISATQFDWRRRFHPSPATILIQFSAQSARQIHIYTNSFSSICLFNLTWNSLTVIRSVRPVSMCVQTITKAYMIVLCQCFPIEWCVALIRIEWNGLSLDVMKTEKQKEIGSGCDVSMFRSTEMGMFSLDCERYIDDDDGCSYVSTMKRIALMKSNFYEANSNWTMSSSSSSSTSLSHTLHIDGGTNIEMVGTCSH